MRELVHIVAVVMFAVGMALFLPLLLSPAVAVLVGCYSGGVVGVLVSLNYVRGLYSKDPY
jgi:hypothetical protein